MSSISNPYTYGKMITDPSGFFGRKQQTAQVLDHARKVQDVSILGKRRIGKSSLLLHCVESSRQLLESSNLILVYVDFQDERTHSVSGFVEHASRKIAAEVGGLNFPLPTEFTLTRLHDAIELLFQGKGVKVALCLDEFEVVADFPGEFDNRFFETLRSIGQTEYISLITATESPLSELCTRNNISSPFHNIFATLYLGLMPPNEARDLVITPSNRSGMPFSEEEITFVLEVAGRHPFYTQMLSHHLFAMKAKDGKVNFDALRKQFRLEAWPHLSYLWSHLSEEEQLAIRYHTGGKSIRPSEITVQGLIAYGLLDSDKRPFSPELAEWIKSQAIPVALRASTVTEKKGPSPTQAVTDSGTRRLIVAAAVGILTFVLALLSLSAVALLLPADFQKIAEEARLVFAGILGFALAWTGYIKAPSFLDWLKGLFGK